MGQCHGALLPAKKFPMFALLSHQESSSETSGGCHNDSTNLGRRPSLLITSENLVVGRGSTAHGLEMVIHMRSGGFGNRPRATYCMEPTAPVGGIKNRVEWPGFCCDQHSFVINIVLSALNFNLHHPRRGSNAAHTGMITWEKIA